MPVFLQAPWVRIQPFSACIFTAVILFTGILLVEVGNPKWAHQIGSLLVGVSGSWLGGCLFWGWLRAHPLWHLPVEAFALPLALGGLTTKWRLGSGFYLSCLLGTAFTDLMMIPTGVIQKWPEVVQAPFSESTVLLSETAQQLLNPQSIIFLLIASTVIINISKSMQQRALISSQSSNTWLVASAALTTTLWVDGLFLITALIQPKISGLI